MSDIMEKIATIELEMSRTQKNKATAAHLGSLKAKLAKLRRDLIEGSTAKSGPKGDGFDVTKTGDSPLVGRRCWRGWKMRMLVLLMTSGSMVKYSTLRIPSFLKPCDPPGMFMSGATNRRWRRCRTSWTQSGAMRRRTRPRA